MSPLSPSAHLPCTDISLLSLAPRIPRSPVQLINSEVRKESSIRDFSMSCHTKVPAPFYSRPTFSPAFLLSPTHFYKPFLSLICLGTFNCRGTLTFLNSTQQVRWTKSLHCCQVTSSCFHILYASFLCLGLTRSIHYHSCRTSDNFTWLPFPWNGLMLLGTSDP